MSSGDFLEFFMEAWFRIVIAMLEQLMESCPRPLERDLRLTSDRRIGTLL